MFGVLLAGCGCIHVDDDDAGEILGFGSVQLPGNGGFGGDTTSSFRLEGVTGDDCVTSDVVRVSVRAGGGFLDVDLAVTDEVAYGTPAAAFPIPSPNGAVLHVTEVVRTVHEPERMVFELLDSEVCFDTMPCRPLQGAGVVQLALPRFLAGPSEPSERWVDAEGQPLCWAEPAFDP